MSAVCVVFVFVTIIASSTHLTEPTTGPNSSARCGRLHSGETFDHQTVENRRCGNFRRYVSGSKTLAIHLHTFHTQMYRFDGWFPCTAGPASHPFILCHQLELICNSWWHPVLWTLTGVTGLCYIYLWQGTALTRYSLRLSSGSAATPDGHPKGTAPWPVKSFWGFLFEIKFKN